VAAVLLRVAGLDALDRERLEAAFLVMRQTSQVRRDDWRSVALR